LAGAHRCDFRSLGPVPSRPYRAASARQTNRATEGSFTGDGSWSIDQQRDNFQFGGQLFYEIKHGKLGTMLRDVAYQSRTLEFWRTMDGLGDKSTWFLGGSFYCGKGQPMQAAPVSHGAVAARFRQITVLNTEREDI
jgi:TldD protein